MGKKQTVVEWLVDQLEKHHVHNDLKNTIVYEQAKAMEKQQKGYSEEEVLGIIRKSHSIKKLHEWFLG